MEIVSRMIFLKLGGTIMSKKIFLIMFFCICMTISCTAVDEVRDVSVKEEIYIEREEKHIEKRKVPPVEITISAVGDIMVHGPQLRAQYDKKNKVYDFKNNFQFIKPYISKSDLAICNLETTFAGNKRKYSSYPRFNTPDSLAEAIKDAGFDVVSTANNHTMDSGKDGVIRTVKVLRNFAFDVVGTKEKETDKNFIIKEVKGIKFGVSAYSYETRKRGKNKTLNGLLVPNEIEGNINTFNYHTIDQDLEKMKKEIQSMKEEGAEVIIFYLHWGTEYQRNPNKNQKRIARSLADLGVDVIFGSHPHVLQPMEFIHSKNREKDTLVVYSMGNFLSNQRYEILKNRYTEDGVIVDVTFIKNFEENEVRIKEVKYLPTWVHKYFKNGKRIYEIVTLDGNLDDQEGIYIENKNNAWRARNSKNNTIKLMESTKDERINVVSVLGRK